MSNITNNTNMYSMLDHWLKNIAPNYFDLDDLSLNRVGLFGYVNEIMAHGQENIMNENSVLYNEFFFKRAVLPKSIYAYASHYAIDETGATPSVMTFAIGISEEELLEKSITDSTGSYFIIDSGTEIILEGEVVYTIDYPIKISIKTDDLGKYVYSAKYLTDGLDNPVSSIKMSSNPFLRLVKVKENKTDFIFIYINAHQVDLIETNKIIYSDDFIEYFTFDITCDMNDDSQIADFTVFYRKPNSDTFEQIEKVLIDGAVSERPFCFYQYRDYNTVNISFSTITKYFRPEFNSELKFVFYTTKGSQGNFEYKGNNVSVNLKSDRYNYENLIMSVKSLSDSTGGFDRLNYEQIKEKVSIMASTCNNIATDNDLNNYFTFIQGAKKILFTKKRDDILDRLYGTFLILKDGEDNIVPTNTVDLALCLDSDYIDKEFDVIQETDKRYIIKPGAELYYSNYKNRCLTRLKDDDNIDKDDIDYIYTNPFTIVINRSPFMAEYYMSSIANSYMPEYAEVNDETTLNFIVNKITIDRNTLVDDCYTIRLNTIPNTDDLLNFEFAEYDDEKKFVRSLENLKMDGVIYDNDNGDVSHRFEFKMVDCDYSTKECTFEAKLKTDDYVSLYSWLRMTENVKDIKSDYVEHPLINATDLLLGFVLFMKEKNPKQNTYHKYIDGRDEFSVTNVYKITEGVPLMTSLTKQMYSSVIYEYDNDGKLNVLLKECPVVRHDYIMKTNYGYTFIKNFLSIFNTLKDNLKFLTNAYNLSIKFYNTCGRSYYFYVAEDDKYILDKVNLSIKLRIRLNPNSLSNTVLKEEIRTFIKNYIEDVNEDINLYISNLTTALEEKFDDISYINFESINEYDTNVQSVEKNFPDSTSITEINRLKDFVPEYLNINRDYNNGTYDVEVAFV